MNYILPFQSGHTSGFNIPYFHQSKAMSSIKTISFFLLVIGLIFMTIGYVKNEKQNTKPVIQYRYIPKTFEEEQNEPDSVNATFSNMFDKRDSWSQTKYYQDKNYNKVVDNSPTYQPLTGVGKSIKQDGIQPLDIDTSL